MRRALLLIVLAGILSAMPGCLYMTKEHYTLGDQVFTSRAEAEIRQRDMLSQTLLGLHRTDTPLGGTALVVLPTRAVIEEKGIKMKSGSRDDLSDDLEEWIAGSLERDLEFTVNAIKQRGIFDEVVLERSASPASRELGTRDYLVYVHLPDPDASSWYAKSRDWTSPKIVPLATGAVGPLQSTVGWLDNLEAVLRSDSP